MRWFDLIGLILWPLFFGVFGVVIAFFWAVVAIKLLKSRLSKNYIICFYILLVVSLALSSINAIVGFFIWLWILKACKLEFKSKSSKVLLYFSSIMLLVSAWQMEIPQRVMFEAFTLNKTMYDIEIVDELFDGNTTSVTYGYSENRKKCIKDIFSCPFIPLPKQLQYHFFTTRNGKEIVIANVYGPYYGKSLLLNYFENLNITHSTYRAFSLNSLSNKEVFEKLRNIKSSQKGENNGDN